MLWQDVLNVCHYDMHMGYRQLTLHSQADMFRSHSIAIALREVHNGSSGTDVNKDTVVPVFSGHPSFPAKVSLHCRCPLIRGIQVYNKTWREF